MSVKCPCVDRSTVVAARALSLLAVASTESRDGVLFLDGLLDSPGSATLGVGVNDGGLSGVGGQAREGTLGGRSPGSGVGGSATFPSILTFDLRGSTDGIR